ncbi:MAG: helix-turn-helix transcriptional regulator [Nitrospirota bacterium]|jgi:transcriptional regulator with XRE-family HTH domain
MEMTLKKEIGERLRKLRKEKALTQKELSKRVAVDYSYIGKIERGEQLPSIKMLIRISEIYSVPIGYFFHEDPLIGLLEHLPEELIDIAGDKKKRIFLKLLKDIDEEDIPLIIEILRLLNEHKRAYRYKGRLLKVAEHRRPYKKKHLS